MKDQRGVPPPPYLRAKCAPFSRDDLARDRAGAWLHSDSRKRDDKRLDHVVTVSAQKRHRLDVSADRRDPAVHPRAHDLRDHRALFPRAALWFHDPRNEKQFPRHTFREKPFLRLFDLVRLLLRAWKM